MAADAISAGIKLAAEAAEIAAVTMEKKNAPDMKAAKVAQLEAEAADAETIAVQERDADQVRKNLAE